MGQTRPVETSNPSPFYFPFFFLTCKRAWTVHARLLVLRMALGRRSRCTANWMKLLFSVSPSVLWFFLFFLFSVSPDLSLSLPLVFFFILPCFLLLFLLVSFVRSLPPFLFFFISCVLLCLLFGRIGFGFSYKKFEFGFSWGKRSLQNNNYFDE